MRPILRNKTNVIRSFFLRRNASLLDNNSDDTTLSWRRVVGQNEVIIQCLWLAVLRLILHTCHAARCAPPGVIRTPPGFTVSSPSWCGRRWNSDVLHLASQPHSVFVFALHDQFLCRFNDTNISHVFSYSRYCLTVADAANTQTLYFLNTGNESWKTKPGCVYLK